MIFIKIDKISFKFFLGPRSQNHQKKQYYGKEILKQSDMHENFVL